MLAREMISMPIAHRGWHDRAQGRAENSPSAFRAAVEKIYAIECDLQPAGCGTAMVFHDHTLDRLTEHTGPVAARTADELAALRIDGTEDRIPRFADLLALVEGRVPLFVEIKSTWTPLPPRFLDDIAREARSYRGPLALMSFDPAVMVEMRRRVPEIPRGIVAGIYRETGWWAEVLPADRRERLSHLLECADMAPDFVSYAVDDLPTPVTRYVREVQRLPLICWTVRSAAQQAKARLFADAPTFEGYEA